MTSVTISASYGTGGAWVGPRVAQALELPFLDRAFPVEVAGRLSTPVGVAAAHDGRVEGTLERVFRALASTGAMFGAPASTDWDAMSERDWAEATEAVIFAHVEHEGAVLLGRGGAVVLAGVPGVLHVRLDAPEERRVHAACQWAGLSPQEARRQMAETDRARETYVRRLYGVDPRSTYHYHLSVDPIALGWEATVEMITGCARAFGQRAAGRQVEH